MLNEVQIRGLRIQNGITQKDLADVLGVAESTYSRYEFQRILPEDLKAKATTFFAEIGVDVENISDEFRVKARQKPRGMKRNRPYQTREKEEEQEVPGLVVTSSQIINAHTQATKPDHYHKGGMDLFEFLELKWTKEQLEAFHAGNVLKYVLRYNDKNGLEDLQKAKVYLDKLIQLHQGE